MIPLACPMITRSPLRLETRSNPRPPSRSWNGTMGRPSSSNWTISRRLATAVSASFSRAIVSSLSGRRRVSRHEKQRALSSRSLSNQLHPQSHCAHRIQRSPSTSTPPSTTGRNDSVGWWNPSAVSHRSHALLSRNTTYPHTGQSITDSAAMRAP